VQAVHGTLDGGTLRTVLDARNYILSLSEARQLRAQWQRASEMLFEDADVAAPYADNPPRLPVRFQRDESLDDE